MPAPRPPAPLDPPGPAAPPRPAARRAPLARPLLGALAGALLACAPAPAPPRPPIDPIPHAPSRAGVVASPTLLAAHLADPTLIDLDPARPIFAVLYLVFSADLDPATVAPDRFLVALDDGRRVYPARALLAPADEPDENRSVALALPLPPGAKAAPRPIAVSIVGELYAEGGEPLHGLTAAVDAAPGPRLVHAVRVAPAPGRCDGAAQAIRLYWSLPLAGDAVDLAAVRVALADGAVAHPLALDDHELGAPLQRADNVVDLCLGAAADATRLTLEPGAFRDLYGRPSAGVDAAIARLRRE